MADNNNPVQDNIAPNGIQINARDRLFYAIFIRGASIYIRVVPKWCRGLLEIILLAKALFLFTTLSYIHFTFSKYPMDCLDKFQDSWPRDGILQVQIIKDHRSNIPVNELQLPPYFASKWNHSLAINNTHREDQCSIYDFDEAEEHHNVSEERKFKTKPNDIVKTVDDEYLMKRETVFFETLYNERLQGQLTFFPSIQHILQFYDLKQVKNHYVMEYSLEYGFLRLSQETRKKLNIPIQVVTLDPKTDKCFGDSVSRFILDKFLGYDDLLMASIKKLAEKEGNRGYMKNVVSGEHYKFVTIWMGRTSYIISLMLMFAFTISISTLLRFSHQQISIFIIHLLHVMEWNASLAFPLAPMFTVILSLVGMEAIMAEFFNDTTTSFYIILIVWAADQFDSICCHTRLSQKYWLRFFYLYHFLFYAYHYRFNGQYSTIALAASWFFIQHAMLYFLHNYEIPAIEGLLNAQGGNYLDDTVGFFDDEIQLAPENVNTHGNEDNAGQPDVDQTPLVPNSENENELGNEAIDSANDETPVDFDYEAQGGSVIGANIDSAASKLDLRNSGYGGYVDEKDLPRNEVHQPAEETSAIADDINLLNNEASCEKFSVNDQTEAVAFSDECDSCATSFTEKNDVSLARNIDAGQVDSNGDRKEKIDTRTIEETFVSNPNDEIDSRGCSTNQSEVKTKFPMKSNQAPSQRHSQWRTAKSGDSRNEDVTFLGNLQRSTMDVDATTFQNDIIYNHTTNASNL